jgi:hypothetical protein
MIEFHLRKARTIEIERAMQAFPVLRSELCSSLLDFIVPSRNTLLHTAAEQRHDKPGGPPDPGAICFHGPGQAI